MSENLMVSDLVRALDLSVLVVARTGLGTINHSLLTIRCARADGLDVIGFVMNRLGSAGLVERTNPAIVSRYGDVPCFGVVEDGSGIDVDSCRLGNTVEIVRRDVDWRKILKLIRTT